ncbi:MAG: hypothetical protein GY799_07760 [Desulfobulbaceae bacterium]|nr:hypothetical protein [Desulfobulbaceae bacterium]
MANILNQYALGIRNNFFIIVVPLFLIGSLLLYFSTPSNAQDSAKAGEQKNTQAVMNYLRPLARTQVPENVLIEVADLIARTIAAEPAISARRQKTWINKRSGKPVYELDQVGESRWAGQVPWQVQEALKRAIHRIQYQDPIGLYAFSNPFSYDRNRNKLSKNFPKRFKDRKPANSGAITGEWVLSGADGLFFISQLNQGKPFSIEKHRDVLKKYQLLAASYSQDSGRTVSYHFFWFDKAPPNWNTILKDLPQGQGLEKIGPPVAQAPDTLTEASSMIFKYKAAVAASAGTGKKPAENKVSLPPKLENPNGLYLVSQRGVAECRVIKKEANGSYRFNWYIVTNKAETLRSGQLASGGWWYPEHQQFYTEPYVFFYKGHSCNGWMKEWGQWSSIIVPEVYTTGNGMTFQGYQSTGKSPAERPKGMRACADVEVKGLACKITCTNWEWTDDLPDAYQLKNKDQALSLYHYLNIRGSRVTSRTKAMAAEKKAKAVEEAKAQKIAAKKKELEALVPLMSVDREKVRFPAELAISPQLHDFILARYYPDKLSQHRLEAMMSSRWTYEKGENTPLGGRFFKKNGRSPTYKELQLLSQYFKPWILGQAKALPETLFMDVPLVYGGPAMKIETHCISFLKSDGSLAGIHPNKLYHIEQKVRDCERRNRKLQGPIDSCRNLQNNLLKAEEQLAQAQANGCQRVADNDSSNNSDGPCANLTRANFKTEMMACITNTCGTPAAGTDIQAYQKCVQDVSNQFKSRLTLMMGGQPVARQQSQPQAVDTCEAARQQVQQIRHTLEISQCDTIIKTFETVDCTSLGMVERPDYMEIGRINLEQMLKCGGGFSIFHHGFRESAELLPKKRPFVSTQFSFMLYPDKLALPYDMPKAFGKSDTGIVNARIKMRVTATDDRSFRRHQLGLKVSVKGIDYTRQQ